jgi:hypothetical protein
VERYRRFVVFDLSDYTTDYVDDINDNSNKTETKSILLVNSILDWVTTEDIKAIEKKRGLR